MSHEKYRLCGYLYKSVSLSVITTSECYQPICEAKLCPPKSVEKNNVSEVITLIMCICVHLMLFSVNIYSDISNTINIFVDGRLDNPGSSVCNSTVHSL